MKLVTTVALIVLSCSVFAQNAVPPKPQGVDLDVTVIERTPRYPAYVAVYSGNLGMGKLHKSQIGAKHWPDEGEKVTFTGRIVNKGTQPAAAFQYEWLMDGKKVGSGTIKSLAPGASVDVMYDWKWAISPHVLKLVVDPDNKIKETFEHNNSLVHDTLGKVLHLVVSEDTYNRLNNCPNLIGTYSCEDLLNWYIDHMNEMFKNSIYPATPNGSRERVRAEFVVVKDQAARDKWYRDRGGTAQEVGFDGGWWFDWREESERWATVIDWGLPHELGHQLGLIDLYQLDCPPDGNRAIDEDGDPVMIGHMSDMIDSMMHGHGPVPWSEHSAYASDTHFMQRRGFYGVYLVAMPMLNYVEILDNQFYPVEGAKITAFQSYGNRIAPQPVFSGVTGADGRFLLPNRSINSDPYVHVLGYDYHENPYGEIQCVGGNGLIFLKIEGRGHTEYRWLEITKLNLAYWRGAKEEAVYPYATGIPHWSAPAAPQNISVSRQENGVRIAWDKNPDAPVVAAAPRLAPLDAGFSNPVIRYNIYRALPQEYFWQKIGMTTARDPSEFIDRNPPHGLVKYAVTAVTTAQSESAFSKPFGYSVYGEPMGVCALPNGRIIVADHKQNQLVYLKPTLSAIGPWNSIHNHSYATDVAVDRDGVVAFTDWPDGYDMTNVGFLLRNYKNADEDERGQSRKWPKGSGDNEIAEPTGIAFDDDGNVILTDSGNNRIDCYKRDGALIWRYKGDLNRPSRAVVWNNSLVIADTGNNRVLLVDPITGDVKSVLTDIASPRYVTTDADTLLVSESGAGAIRLYEAVNGLPKLATTIDVAELGIKEPVGVACTADNYIVADAASKVVVFVKRFKVEHWWGSP